MRGTVYGYARCSTTEKRQDVERQAAELYAMGAHTVVQEYASGGSPGRERLAELVAAIGDGDTLVATEVSRVTRSLGHLCEVIALARAKGLLLRFGTLDFDFAGGRVDAFRLAMLQIMGVFAELERNLTAERIASGLAAARAGGARLGRPPKAAADVPASARLHWAEYRRGGMTVAEYARRAGLSRPTAYKYIGLLRQDELRQDELRQDKLRQDELRQDELRQEEGIQDVPQDT